MSHRKKVLHNNKNLEVIKKKKDSLHLLLNDIFTRLFKELTKYKNDYQQYLNYIRMTINKNDTYVNMLKTVSSI